MILQGKQQVRSTPDDVTTSTNANKDSTDDISRLGATKMPSLEEDPDSDKEVDQSTESVTTSQVAGADLSIPMGSSSSAGEPSGDGPQAPTAEEIDSASRASSEDETPGNSSGEPASEESPKPPPALYKSRRFKGYLTIFLASIINYNSAKLSDQPIDKAAVPATKKQKSYALAVGLLSAIVTGLLVLIHLDRYSPLESSLWRPAFSPKSRFETVLILLMFLWWSVAAIIQTSVRGIAGDGKEQYNLYYSTWGCCWTCLWIAERKLVDYGYPTFRSFVTSWPHRAPGWIAIFILDFLTLWWYVDLFNSTKEHPERIPKQLVPFYEPISRSQYQWLLFVAGFTLLPSAIFIIVEILRGTEDESTQQQQQPSSFRALTSNTPSATSPRLKIAASSPSNAAMVIGQVSQSRHPEKKSIETILEGFCLLCLTVGWIPSVIAATTPGGFASQIGNAYFCTWATTVFVLETFVWFIHDWRKSVHATLEEKQREYRQHQRQVLEQTLQRVHMQGTFYTDDDDEDEDDDDEDDDGSNILGYADGDDEERSEYYEDDYNDHSQYVKREDDKILPPRAGATPIHGRSSSSPKAPPTPINLFHPDEDEDEDYGAATVIEEEKKEDGDDNIVARELRLKQENEKAYFDDLDDILK